VKPFPPVRGNGFSTSTRARTLSWLLLSACSGPEPEPPADEPAGELAPSYLEPGPWPVGTREETIVGTDGLELTVQVWYPARSEGAATVTYDGLLAGGAYEGAPADCAEPHPLLAFSHGYEGVRYQSPFLTEHLASHGYVVVSPDHVGNTFSDPSGDLTELFARRPVDLRDSVDWLLAQVAAPGSPYEGCADPASGYAVSGHSFGGWTALATAGAELAQPGDTPAADDRVWAVLALAPWDGAGAITDGTSAITVPTMILTGELDETTPISQVRDLWRPMTAEPRWLGVFPEAGHYSFSPVACLLYDDDGCGDGFIDEVTFTARVNTASAAFLEGIRGVSGALEQIPLEAAEIDWTVR
jgi:predicted dienelactone hydrolase